MEEKDTVYTLPFCFILIEFVFGMYFNDIIPGFTNADEILEILLLVGTFFYSIIYRKPVCLAIKIFTVITLFYLVYSFYIQSNVPVAILSDILLQIKPFVAFFCIIHLGIALNKSQKRILKKVALYLYFITLVIAIFALFSEEGFYSYTTNIYGHPTRFGTAVIFISVIYLFCSDFNNTKKVVTFILILSLSLLSTRSKVLGFFIASLILVLFMKNKIEMKLSLKNVLIFSVLILITGYVAREKLSFYFLDYDISENEHALARPMLYLTSFEILKDYFPFGSGFASFATHFSGVYYSPLYEHYELNTIWGLLEEDPAYVTDVQYPSIAQFGVVGLMFYLIFWIKVIKEANAIKRRTKDNQIYVLIVLIIVFLAIESIADAVFTGNRGFFAMLLLALFFNSGRETYVLVNCSQNQCHEDKDLESL